MGITWRREQSVPCWGLRVTRDVTEQAKCPSCSAVGLVIIAETGCIYKPFCHIRAPQQILGQKTHQQCASHQLSGEKSLTLHVKPSFEMLDCWYLWTEGVKHSCVCGHWLLSLACSVVTAWYKLDSCCPQVMLPAAWILANEGLPPACWRYILNIFCFFFFLFFHWKRK